MPQRFNLRLTPRDSSSKIKGINSSIPYLVRVNTPDWSAEIAGTDWEEQRFGENDETDECWEWSGIDDSSPQIVLFLNLKQLPQTHIDFLSGKNVAGIPYFNPQGLVSISRRYLGILSNMKDQGGDTAMFWGLVREYGVIPRSMLDFTPTEADMASREAFVADYYNENAVTPAMKALGAQFNTLFNSDFEYVGNDGSTPPPQDLSASLLQSPLQIAIPIPQDVSTWNQAYVPYDGTQIPSHEVVLYKVDFIGNPDYPYFILDQYQPAKKQLSKDYLLYRVTNGVITPILPPPFVPPPQAVPYPQGMFAQVMQNVWAYLSSLWS